MRNIKLPDGRRDPERMKKIICEILDKRGIWLFPDDKAKADKIIAEAKEIYSKKDS